MKIVVLESLSVGEDISWIVPRTNSVSLHSAAT